MQWQDLAIAGMGLGGSVLGWLLRVLWDSVERMRADMQALQNSLPHVYARRDDMKEMFSRILESLEHLNEKLDRKADK